MKMKMKRRRNEENNEKVIMVNKTWIQVAVFRVVTPCSDVVISKDLSASILTLEAERSSETLVSCNITIQKRALLPPPSGCR